MSTITTPRPETTHSETRTKLDPPVRGGPLDRAHQIVAAWLAAHSVLALARPLS